MKYWPGTKVPKSTGNAFDLRLAGELAGHMRRTQVKATAGAQGAKAQQNASRRNSNSGVVRAGPQ